MKKSCPLGMTRDDLLHLFGDGLAEFDRWMVGQTGAICDGREYDYDTKKELPTACADNPHGCVVYTWDVNRYLNGLRVD